MLESLKDYDKVTTIADTIKFVRCEPPNQRDFLVLINGEHRATFRSNMRYSRKGYDFRGADGGSITGRRLRYDELTQSEFLGVVQENINAIPTLAQIERVHMIIKAEQENREWDDAQAKHRHEVRRQVLTTALALYINEKHKNPANTGGIPHGVDEHYDLAQSLFKRYSAPDFDGWF